MSASREHQIAEEVEQTLRAFDQDEPLEENPFLISRLKAVMNSRLPGRHEGFPARFNPKYVVMAVILLINLITVVHYLDWNSTRRLQEELVTELQEDFQIDQSQSGF